MCVLDTVLSVVLCIVCADAALTTLLALLLLSMALFSEAGAAEAPDVVVSVAARVFSSDGVALDPITRATFTYSS